MRELFADTDYWIAVFDPDDLHAKAMTLSQSLGTFHIITT